MDAAAPVPFGFRVRVIGQQPLTERVIKRAAVVQIAHDPASGSATEAAACGAAAALSGPGGFELADQRHDFGSDLVVNVGGRARRGYDPDLAAGRARPRCRHLGTGAGLGRQVLRRLGQAEHVEQQPAFMLAGPVPPGAGERLGGGQLPGLVAVGGLAHPAPAGGAVLLQAAFLGPAARFGLGQDPGAAALDLDLGEAGAAAKRVVGEPPRQLPLHRRAGVVLGVGDRRPQVQRVDEAPARSHRGENRRVTCRARRRTRSSTDVLLSCIVGIPFDRCSGPSGALSRWGLPCPPAFSGVR